MTPPGSGSGSKPPVGIVVNHPNLQRVVRNAPPPIVAPPAPPVGRTAAEYTGTPLPQTPAAKSGGLFGLVRRVFGGSDAPVVAETPADVVPAFDPSQFFGFRHDELADAPTGAIPVGPSPASFRVGATIAFVPGEGVRSHGLHEHVSPRGSGDTAPNPVVQAHSSHQSGSAREDHTAVLTRALPRDLARPAARQQPVARPVVRPAAAAASAATADTAGPTIDNIVGDIRRAHTNSGLTFTARTNGAHGISVTATQSGRGGSIRISADTLAAPDEDAMAAVIASVEPFGQRNVRPAYDIAVVFENPQTMLELATARGLRYVKEMEALIILEGNRGEHSVAARNTVATQSAAGSLWVVGALTARNFPLDHSQVPQILVVIPWPPTVQRSDALYREDVRTAMTKLRAALRRVVAALPNTEADSGGGQRRR